MQQDALAAERRARMAAERLLEQKQKELFAANAELSKHALALTDEIVEKREEVEVVRGVADELRGENTQVKQDLEQATEAADIAERRLWDSVETIEDGFAVFDVQDTLIAANSAYLSVFDGMECVRPGITYGEIIAIMASEGIVDPGDLMARDWCKKMDARWASAALDPLTIKLWNGQFIKLLDRRSENGDTVSLALNITDTIRREDELTEARNNAEAANRAKSAFLAKMSHELRTPMNGVVGMADLLVESDLDDDQKLYVDTIKSSGEALLELINDVLDFSKMEAAKLVLHAEEFDLEQVLTEVMMLFQPAVMQKNIELLIDYDMFLPTQFLGDPGRIRQILTNLMGNAVKFTETGHVLVRVVGLPNGEGDDMRIHITIEDTGPGIPENMVDHIFGEFNQVEDEKNRRFEGTGLGLAITKQLVELMQGKIWVDSELGHGSSFGFHINLPITGPTPSNLEPIPDWIGRVIMLSRPSQFSHILSKQLRVLGYDTLETTMDDFVQENPAKPGDIVVIDEENEGKDVSTVIQTLGNDEQIPIVVFQASSGNNAEALGPHIVPLMKPTKSRTLVQAFSQLTPPKAVALTATPDGTKSPELSVRTESEQSDQSPVMAVPPDTMTPALPRQMRILAAEDNKTNRLVFSKMVGKLNVELVFAENGEEAVEKWQSFKPDMIFMDISMPVMDGKQATREIRQLELEGEHTPIVALTAHAMSGDDSEILAAGLDHYLTKPLRKAAIFDQIRAATPDNALDVFAEPENGSEIRTPPLEQQ